MKPRDLAGQVAPAKNKDLDLKTNRASSFNKRNSPKCQMQKHFLRESESSVEFNLYPPPAPVMFPQAGWFRTPFTGSMPGTLFPHLSAKNPQQRLRNHAEGGVGGAPPPETTAALGPENENSRSSPGPASAGPDPLVPARPRGGLWLRVLRGSPGPTQGLLCSGSGGRVLLGPRAPDRVCSSALP